MLGAARGIGHDHLHGLHGRLVEHERLGLHAVAAEHGAHRGRDAKARLHDLAAGHGERRARRSDRSRAHERGRVSLRARVGLGPLARGQHAGDRARGRLSAARPAGSGAHARHQLVDALRVRKLDADGLAQARALGVDARPRYGRRRRGRAREAHMRRIGRCRRGAVERARRRGRREAAFEPLVRLVDELVPDVRIRRHPAEETPALARKARSQVARGRCRLHHQEAVAARRIDQRLAAASAGAPTCQRQKSGRERARQRGVGTVVRREVGTVVQRFARQVERDRGAPLPHAHIHRNVGMIGVDVGTFAAHLTQTVAYGILHLERREPGVAQLVVHAVRLHGHARARNDDALPGDAPHALVQQVRIACVHAPHHHEDARSQPRPQARRQRMAHVAEKGDAPAEGAHALDAQTLQLFGERRLQTGQAASEQFEVFVIHTAQIQSSHAAGWRSKSARRTLVFRIGGMEKAKRTLRTRVFAIAPRRGAGVLRSVGPFRRPSGRRNLNLPGSLSACSSGTGGAASPASCSRSGGCARA